MEKTLNKNLETLSTKWIEKLALNEINMEHSGIIDLDTHLNTESILEESSIEFMNQLRDLFEIYTTKFNELRCSKNRNGKIRIFKISNTVNDFILFRNSLRLSFSKKSNDLIHIGLIANGKDLYGTRLAKEEITAAHKIKAHIGPFNTISWLFQGEAVEIKTLVKHYFSEFVIQSAQ